MCRLDRLNPERHVAAHHDLELREYWLGHDQIAAHHARCVELIRHGLPENDEPDHSCPVVAL